MVTGVPRFKGGHLEYQGLRVVTGVPRFSLEYPGLREVTGVPRFKGGHWSTKV